ncbi:MAG: TOBE domain-containing protein [Comamonadaceae bacterium]|nr:TOBE domain-containing protein [Comamonadaceae bacterium]
MDQPPLSPDALGHARTDKRIDILKQVARHGSISEAARHAGVSYKAAWQAIHTLTNLAGVPLVESSVGGAGGGGARLTPAGERLLQAAGLMDEARRDVLARVNAAPGVAASALAAPRTSMRNHLRCTVAALHSDGARDPMVRVTLALAGGGEMAASITRESAELLGLAPGLPVLALAKATAVQVQAAAVASGPSGAGASRPDTAGGNGLAGRVLRLSRGAQRDEVTLTLAGGQQLVGFAGRPHRLRHGSRALAWLDESAVVIALG